MKETVKIELTEDECGIICTALSFWSWENLNISEETCSKITELIEKITNAY